MKIDLDKVLAEMGKEREGVLHLELSKALFEIEKLRARLAAVEAERDAAQKRVQDCETRMMRYAIQLGEMQAERDAARAGEENKIK